MSDSDKLDQILKMLADLDSRVTRLEESKGKGKSDSGEESDDEQDDEQSDQDSDSDEQSDSGSEDGSEDDAESSDGEEQDSDSADSADDGSDSEADGNGDPADESQDPPEEWDTPDPVENEFPEEPRKGKPQGGNASDEQEDDGNTCDALNCNICAGTSMRASVPWSDSGEPL